MHMEGQSYVVEKHKSYIKSAGHLEQFLVQDIYLVHRIGPRLYIKIPE